MFRLPSSRLLRSAQHHVDVAKLPSDALSKRVALTILASKVSRHLATVHDGHKTLPDVWFTGTRLCAEGSFNTPPQKPDARTVKLGKSKFTYPSMIIEEFDSNVYSPALRILQERLPTLLQSPLPQEILSPQITLHLFPSTHPHLPTVSGRVGYSAALWTSPIAWGRLPLVGNVKLEILSERMIKHPARSSRPEQLVVRWRTIGKTKGKGTGGLYKGIGASESVDKITEWLGGGKGENDKQEFTGLFFFEFDEEGRLVSHTIEHVQEGGNRDQGMGARVVGLTDWLLGSLKNGRGQQGAPCPAFWSKDDERDLHRRR